MDGEQLYVIKKDTLTSAANSIRNKTGKSDPIDPENFDAEIDSILTPQGTKQIDSNGSYDVASYESVDVDVPIPSGYIKPSGTILLQSNATYDVTKYAAAQISVPNTIPSGYIKPSGTKEITSNGTHDVTEYASVEVMVEPNLESLTIQEINRNYTASEMGVDGFSEVIMDLPTGVLTVKENNRTYRPQDSGFAAFTLVDVAIPKEETKHILPAGTYTFKDTFCLTSEVNGSTFEAMFDFKTSGSYSRKGIKVTTYAGDSPSIFIDYMITDTWSEVYTTSGWKGQPTYQYNKVTLDNEVSVNSRFAIWFLLNTTYTPG